MQESKKTFSTFDLNLAVILITLNFPVESLDKQNRNKVEFYFKRGSRLDEIIQAYWSKNLKLEPQTLFANQKALKNRLYSS